MSEKSAMSDFASSHRRHHDYSYRLPTPPRILVPPPSLCGDRLELNMGKSMPPPDGELDLSFFKDWNLANIVQNNTLMEWAYERRRQAQMILPWLYLGPLTAAKDKDFLIREGITMILAIRAQHSMSGTINIAKELCHEIATVEAPTYFSLVGQFPGINKTINQHIAKVRQLTAAAGEPRMGKVLVFCESGNERSAAVVAAYMMEMLEDFPYVKAMQVCQAQRFCVNFEDSIKNVLRTYWDILLAQRSVAIHRSDSIHSPVPLVPRHQLQPSSYGGKPKRTIEDTRDDEDTEMADGIDPNDELRFSGRDNTPFRDR